MTALEKTKEKFEDLKSKSQSLKDVMYLDGVLAVIDTLSDYEKEERNSYARLQIEMDRKRVKEKAEEIFYFIEPRDLKQVYEQIAIKLD